MTIDFIRQQDVPKEYPFSLATLYRWRRDGALTTYREGKKRVLLSREELDLMLVRKEKVAVASSDEESGNDRRIIQIQCKDTTSSLEIENITIKKNEDGQNSISEAENHRGVSNS